MKQFKRLFSGKSDGSIKDSEVPKDTLYQPYEAQEPIETELDKLDTPPPETVTEEGKEVEQEETPIEELFKNVKVDASIVKPISLDQLKGAHEFVIELMKSNPVFKKFPLQENTPSRRDDLPCKRDPNAQVNVWKLLKSNIGRDLSRIAMPVYVNDPISMLQKTAEILEFSYFLKMANHCEDKYMRLVYIMCFFFALNPYSVDRLKKPFNPMLGETFEFDENGVKFIAEQVSHHPPISAFHCESDDFIFDGYYNTKTTISMSGFVVTPKGPFTIKLLRTKETYTFEKPRTSLHNFIIGSMYLWYYGDAIITNQNTKDQIILNYKAKGWTSAHDYEVDGKVRDASGKTQIQLVGKWDQSLKVVGKKGEDVTVFSKPELPANASDNYFFSSFCLNLNHLTPEKASSLPPTDSRFRPDQRAYEHGDIPLATEQKLSLEELQRTKRKQLEETKKTWSPLWFHEFTDDNGEPLYQYNGKYFVLKEMKEWPKNIPNIFGSS